ncbi:methyltransferase domain-containing protein [Natronolimnohabitans sp. A-GB9]|uniref:class I SAM-dependent methyltransferase n=1 Tax=Natronolimnohabitans sp. A-GB9 TaxID=3069757 RepID=UPI0027AFBCBE|nr:class I SAM-dependent methyltransferase [Natronolimnohabitans sp. A-GB9]MDQ2052745.1 methyltransferase domain-containing protein [Natronolimnohabitans sp. A-GB9]
MIDEKDLTAWQLEQSASDAYEEYLVPPILDPWAERLINSVRLGSDDRVLDVGCGTGIVARRAIAELNADSTVVGLDRNERMLAKAEEEAGGSEPAIEWRQGDAADLSFADEQFDVVFCQQALQFFDQPETALAEMRRVLAPDGRIACSIWRPIEYQPGYIVLAEALERHVGDEAGLMIRGIFPGWNTNSVRNLAREAGFDDVTLTIEIGDIRYPSISEFVRREAASSPLAEHIAGVAEDVREELIGEVTDKLIDYTDDEGIISPMETYVIKSYR